MPAATKKYFSKSVGSLVIAMFAVLLVAFYFVFPFNEQESGSLAQPLKSAQANAYCIGMELTVNVYDVTAGQAIGSYYSNVYDGPLFDISIPYGHVVSYSFDPGGTPSFTAGRYYTTQDGYVHDEHTYTPDPTPGMGTEFTAPPIRSNGQATFQVHQNSCTPLPQQLPQPTPPDMTVVGEVGAFVYLNITVTDPPVLTCSIAASNTNPNLRQYTLALNGGASGNYDVVMRSNPIGPVMLNEPVSLNPSNSYTAIANVDITGVPQGSYILTFVPGGGVPDCQASLEVVPASNPSVTVFYNGQEVPPLINNNDNGIISWQTRDVRSCSASTIVGSPPAGGEVSNWSGNILPLNSPSPAGRSVGPLQAARDYYIFRLECIGLNNELVSDDVIVDFGGLPRPRAKLYCLGDQDDRPPKDDICHASYGSSATLSWGPNDYSANCTINPGNIPAIPAYSGEMQTSNLYATITYTMICYGPDGEPSVPDDVTVQVGPVGLTATLMCRGPNDAGYQLNTCRVDSGSIVSLEYNSPGAETCDIAPQIGSVTPPHGFRNTLPITVDTTFTLNCRTGTVTAPPSQVNIIVNQGEEDFNISCESPSYLVQGGSAYFQIETNSLNGFNKSVNFSTNVSVVGDPGEPEISYPVIEPISSQIPGNPRFRLVGVSAADDTPAIDYMASFTATSRGITHTKVCYFTVSEQPLPPSPTTVKAEPGLCERIVVSWTHASPRPEEYVIYHSFSDNDPSGQEVGRVSGQINSFEYRVDPAFVDRVHYFAVASSSGGRLSPRAYSDGSGVNPCAPDMNLSDKDLISVRGKINKTFTPVACNDKSDAVTLPNNALFTSGDRVTFQINICNADEEGALTNGRVVDTMYNPNNINTQFNLEYVIGSVSTNPAGCAGEISESLHELSFAIPELLPKDPGTVARSCAVRFTATLKTPQNPTSKVYRFQNMGEISGNFPTSPKLYSTPPYLFSLTGIPEREETAPRQ